MRIVCISDTHGDHEKVDLPVGDVLVHAGDCTAHGTREDFHAFIEWFSSQTHKHKIFIAGNHDFYLENEPDNVLAVSEQRGVHYLCDTGVEIDGVKFWGSPITPEFHEWAFMRNEEEIKPHWSLIPKDTQVLITHGPVWGVLDEVRRSETLTENTGCPELGKTISEIKPDYHVFGHIHEGFGELSKDGTRFLNVSTMNLNYKIQNPAVFIDID